MRIALLVDTEDDFNDALTALLGEQLRDLVGAQPGVGACYVTMDVTTDESGVGNRAILESDDTEGGGR